MIIIPAIDLKDGNCVRLYKGNFDTVHKVAENAVNVARIFTAAGADIIHMVDLDGALAGKQKNADIVKSVAMLPNIKVELGGGLRSMNDLKVADELGVWRFVIGSAAVSDPDFLQEAVAKYGDRIAVGIDAKDGIVRTHGWVDNSGIDALEFALQMEHMGVKTIIYTDIETDGTLSGSPISQLKRLRDLISIDIVASGGVSTIDDIINLRDISMDAAIIGKAYYAGTIDLNDAIRRAKETC